MHYLARRSPPSTNTLRDDIPPRLNTRDPVLLTGFTQNDTNYHIRWQKYGFSFLFWYCDVLAQISSCACSGTERKKKTQCHKQAETEMKLNWSRIKQDSDDDHGVGVVWLRATRTHVGAVGRRGLRWEVRVWHRCNGSLSVRGEKDPELSLSFTDCDIRSRKKIRGVLGNCVGSTPGEGLRIGLMNCKGDYPGGLLPHVSTSKWTLPHFLWAPTPANWWLGS